MPAQGPGGPDQSSFFCVYSFSLCVYVCVWRGGPGSGGPSSVLGKALTPPPWDFLAEKIQG